MKEYMSDEARRYYEGGKRVMIDGVPCRVAAWARRTPGKALIKAAVAAQMPIGDWFDHGDISLARFRFEPANGAREDNRKPSKVKGFAYKARFKSQSGWTPANLACDRYAVRQLTETPWELQKALSEYHKGSPAKLREYLADTADERRAYWAAYDAAQEAERAAMWRLAA